MPGMVVLTRREGVGQAVDGGRRSGHHLAHPGLHRRFQDVERTVDHHLERCPRLLGALSDADGRLVEDHVGAAHETGQQRTVANVAFDQLHTARRERRRQVVAPAPDEVVEHDDLGHVTLYELVDDGRTDGPGATGDECTGAIERDAVHGDRGVRS